MSTMDSTPRPQRFTPFRRLPIELRLKIWEHYHDITTPQLLTVRLYSADASTASIQKHPCLAYHHLIALKQRSIPNILHICSESRIIGLSRYKLGFDVQHSGNHAVTCAHQHASETSNTMLGKNIYWDPEKDIVHIEVGWASPESTFHTWGGSPEFNLHDVRHLAINDINYWPISHASLGFDKLKTVFLITRLTDPYHGPPTLRDFEEHWANKLLASIRSPTKESFTEHETTMQPTVRFAGSLRKVVNDLTSVGA